MARYPSRDSTIIDAQYKTKMKHFFLRISGPGDYRYEGADLGILVTRGRLMTKNFRLNRRAKRWIRGLQSFYQGQSLDADEEPLTNSFKLL